MIATAVMVPLDASVSQHARNHGAAHGGVDKQ